MTLKFDHFVHLTPDPTKALEAFQEHGLHAVQGGRHEDHGTFNTLSYFGLSYVELIGVFDETLATQAGAVKYSLRETFVKNDYVSGPQRIALRSTNLEALAEHLSSLGYDVNGPVDMSRRRPDGSLLSWKLLFAGTSDEAFNLPFFIEWNESDEERFADLTKRETIAPHARGEVTVDGAAFVVSSIDAVIDQWAQALQLEKGKKYVDVTWNATAQRLLLPGGDIIFYEPNGDGVVQDALLKKQGLFALQLTSAKQEQVSIYDAIYRFK
jgi:hypothetical protein